MKKLLIILIITLFSFSLFGTDNNRNYVFSLRNYTDFYTMLEQIQFESGITPDTMAYPLTLGEVNRILNQVDISNPLYEKILNEIPEYKPLLIKLSAEVYINADDLSNSNAPFEAELYPKFGDYFSGEIDLPVEAGIGITGDDLAFPSNWAILENLEMMDIQFPMTAFSSIGGEQWNFSMGRDILSYGSGSSGNMLISDDSTYHDFIRVKGWGRFFHYNYTVINIEALDDIGDLDNSFEAEIEYDDEGEITGVSDSEDIKMLFSHNLDIKPFKNFRITFNEVFLRAGTEITLDVINPFTIMHNMVLTDVRDNDNRLNGNAMFTAELNYTPIPGLNLYGLYLLDQYQTASETDRVGEDYEGEPDAYGVQTGINYSRTFNKELNMLFNVEYVYTNPHLYRSEDTANLYANTWQYHSVYYNDNITMVEPLGYLYGPDARVIKAGVVARLLDNRLRIGVDYIFLEKGEQTLEDQQDNGSVGAAMTTPTGDAEITHYLETDISYKITDDLSVYIRTSDLEFIVGGSYNF